jgi:hypothetical protein
MHRQVPAVPRRTTDWNRDENVRFGSKADILPLAVRFSGKVLPMEAQMASVDVIRTCLV